MSNLRLAVLLCDEIIAESFGNVPECMDYVQIYRQFLTTSLAEINKDVTFTLDGYDVMNDMSAYPPEDTHYDGILISGSRVSADDDLPWIKKLTAYAKHAIMEKPSVKVFGICFGHQIICKAFGGTVQKGDWEISVTTINLTSIGRAIFRAPELHLQEFHHDQVTGHPPHAHLLGSSDMTPNQGIVIFDSTAAPLPADFNSDVKLTSIQVLTLQAHPEFTEFFVRTTLKLLSAYFPQDLVEDANTRVGLPTDAIGKVGRVIWEVLGVTSEC